jgi:hypothetical protein
VITTIIVVSVSVAAFVSYIYLGRPGKSADSIVSSFAKVVNRLETHAETQQEAVINYARQRFNLKQKEEAAKSEAEKAAVIAAKIKEIING